MRIGELAARAGCQTATVRFYEKKGLLASPARSGANYRVYDDADLDRLGFILHCRRHGIGLEDIGKLLVLRDHPQDRCGFAHDLIAAQLTAVEERIVSLQKLKAALEALNCARACGQNGNCAILALLNAPGQCPGCLAAQFAEEDLR